MVTSWAVPATFARNASESKGIRVTVMVAPYPKGAGEEPGRPHNAATHYVERLLLHFSAVAGSVQSAPILV